jgi:multidrug transporter EmrE-like cation transporter
VKEKNRLVLKMEWTDERSEPLLSGDKVSVRQNVLCLGLLFVTIALETFATLMLKHSLVDNRIYVLAFASYFSSLGLFAYVLKYIPLSIAYTTWCTFGTVSVCVCSSVIYGETMKPFKWVCVACTIPCVVGLYLP